MNNICTVVVNSCDKYEDAWYPFFELSKKYWKGCEYPFILNTESKNYNHSGINLSVVNYKPTEGHMSSWGARFRNCLANVHSKYVIILLEDFFFQKEVDQKEIDSCIEMMENNSHIKAIYFKQIDGYKEVYDENPLYFHMKEKKRYILNLQAAIWRTEDLIAFTHESDSPWSFEEEGSSRVGADDIFLCSTRGTHTDMSNCAFPYLTDRRTGFGIWAGKWLWNNNKLFKQNGIELPSLHMDKFTRIDMLKYYMHRISQEITKRISKQ